MTDIELKLTVMVNSNPFVVEIKNGGYNDKMEKDLSVFGFMCQGHGFGYELDNWEHMTMWDYYDKAYEFINDKLEVPTDKLSPSAH